MESLRQIGAGFLLALISISLVFGGFVLSVVEGGGANSMLPTALASLPVIETSQATLPALTALVPGTSQAPLTEVATLIATQAATGTLPPTPASCLPPAGWVVVVVQSSDTLNLLAQTYQTTALAIMNGNCLFSDQLVVGSFLYVPPRPTATFIACGQPQGWVKYTVVAGDTLYNISLRYFNTTVAKLQNANCLGSSTYIQVGQKIWVPYLLLPTPVRTATAPWTATATQNTVPLVTDTPVSPTSVPPTLVTPPTDTPEPTLPAPTNTPEPPTFTPEPPSLTPSPTPGG